MRLLFAIYAVFGWSLLTTASLAELPNLDRTRAGNHCTEQWTKRGNLDLKMYDYCMERQEEGYSEALLLREKYANLSDIDDISDYAVRKWLRAREYQYEMVAYEIENQIDAFLNIAYDLKSSRYSEQDVFLCLAKWYKESEPQWTMVEYCLKK